MGYGELLHKSEQRTISSAICVYIDANSLHELNNERGHEAGDLMLRFVAESLMEQFPKGSLYRVGGDEFVVFPAPAEGQTCEDRMRSASASITAQGYSISYGIAAHESVVGLRELVREADEKMLESKRAYYAEHDRRVRQKKEKRSSGDLHYSFCCVPAAPLSDRPYAYSAAGASLSSHLQLRTSGRSMPLSRMYWRCSTSLSCIFCTR